MAPPVAIVTGGSSGIGLALTKHLLERRWNVVVADLNPPKEKLDGTIFIKTNVASWDEQAALFKQAYAWHGRLDFCALNAGVDDRDDIFSSISRDPSKPPKQPNMKTFEINEIGVYYGCKLAAHYMSLDSKAAGKAKAGGKIVITSSTAGLYPFPLCPQYTASKSAVVALVRALAPAASMSNIRIGAVCPAFVATPFAPSNLTKIMKGELVTPMSTIMRCFSELANFDDVEKPDWVETGRTGDVVEGNLEELKWHAGLTPLAQSSSIDPEGLQLWIKTYAERNVNFAAQDWKAQK